ncbi:MAG TPA: hypothetical protein VME46_04390 [Acidimicrobiales bacterium]|nr:hypothetical protein [Acidimicrobiales bacterium]
MTDADGAPRPDRAISCQQALEAASARCDGEQVPIAELDLDAHLASCGACREFDAGVAALGRQLRLRPARAVPEGLMAELAPLLEPSARTLRFRLMSLFAPSRGPSWAGTAQWAGASISVALASLGLCLGVGAHPHLVPTRPPSPCTAGLDHHRPAAS